MASLLVRTFVIGLAVAVPVGAMGVLCIERTLERGWRSGMVTGIGIATADALYAGLAAFGIAAISSALLGLRLPLALVGGSVLVWMGVRSLVRVRPSAARSLGPQRLRGFLGDYASAVTLTLANPMTILAFAGILAGAGLAAQPGRAEAAVATAGVGLGSLSWWLVLVTAVALARKGMSAGVASAVTRASGALVIAFGVYVLAAGLASAL